MLQQILPPLRAVTERDGEGIGVPDSTKRIMFDAFMEFDRWKGRKREAPSPKSDSNPKPEKANTPPPLSLATCDYRYDFPVSSFELRLVSHHQATKAQRTKTG